MAQYKLTRTNVILELDGGIAFEARPGNRHYQEYLAWLDLGNTPLPADPEPEPSKSAVTKEEAAEWYNTKQAAGDVLKQDIAALEAEVAAHVATMFPLAKAEDHSREVEFRMSVLVIARQAAYREGFVE